MQSNRRRHQNLQFCTSERENDIMAFAATISNHALLTVY